MKGLLDGNRTKMLLMRIQQLFVNYYETRRKVSQISSHGPSNIVRDVLEQYIVRSSLEVRLSMCPSPKLN